MKRRSFLQAVGAAGVAAIAMPEARAYVPPTEFFCGEEYDRLGTLSRDELMRCHCRTQDGRRVPMDRVEFDENPSTDIRVVHFTTPPGGDTAFVDLFDDRGRPIIRFWMDRDNPAKPGEPCYLGMGFRKDTV